MSDDTAIRIMKFRALHSGADEVGDTSTTSDLTFFLSRKLKKLEFQVLSGHARKRPSSSIGKSQYSAPDQTLIVPNVRADMLESAYLDVKDFLASLPNLAVERGVEERALQHLITTQLETIQFDIDRSKGVG